MIATPGRNSIPTKSKTISNVLRLLFELSFSILLACDADQHRGTDLFASLLNSLLCSVLVPLVGTFFSLSAQHLQCLLASSELAELSGSPAVFDCRPGLLTLFRSILSSLNLNLSTNTPPRRCDKPLGEREEITSNYRLELSLLHHSLILDTLRHLREILGQAVIDAENQKSNKHGRVMRLSIKNTIWYICSALHIVMGLEVRNTTTIDPSCFIGARATRLRLLKSTALNSLVGFLSQLDKKRRVHAAMRLSTPRLGAASKISGGESFCAVPPVLSVIQTGGKSLLMFLVTDAAHGV